MKGGKIRPFLRVRIFRNSWISYIQISDIPLLPFNSFTQFIVDIHSIHSLHPLHSFIHIHRASSNHHIPSTNRRPTSPSTIIIAFLPFKSTYFLSNTRTIHTKQMSSQEDDGTAVFLSDDQKLDIIRKFILEAPPGELTEVIHGALGSLILSTFFGGVLVVFGVDDAHSISF